jgi:hypothetical protein
MALSFFRRDSLLVVVPQQSVEEVNSLVWDEALVLRWDEAGPRLALVAAKDVVVLGVEVDVVLLEILWSDGERSRKRRRSKEGGMERKFQAMIDRRR